MSSVDDARKLIASRRVVPQVVCSSKLLISTSSAPTRRIAEALSGKIPTRFWTSALVGNRCRRSGFAWPVRGSVRDHETHTCRAAVDKGLRNLRWVRGMQLGYRLRDPRFATERFDEITAYNALAIRQAGARKGAAETAVCAYRWLFRRVRLAGHLTVIPATDLTVSRRSVSRRRRIGWTCRQSRAGSAAPLAARRSIRNLWTGEDDRPPRRGGPRTTA